MHTTLDACCRQDYSKLFSNLIRETLEDVDAATPFVDSSPSNGLLSREPYAKR